jgi:TolA-binding protein
MSGSKKNKSAAPDSAAVDTVFSKKGKLCLDGKTQTAIKRRLRRVLLGAGFRLIIVGIIWYFVVDMITGLQGWHLFFIVLLAGASYAFAVRIYSVAAYALRLPSTPTWEALIMPLVRAQIDRMYTEIQRLRKTANSAQDLSDKLRELERVHAEYKADVERDVAGVEELRERIRSLRGEIAESEHRVEKWRRRADYARETLQSLDRNDDKPAALNSEDDAADDSDSPRENLAGERLDTSRAAPDEGASRVTDWLSSLDDGRRVYIVGPRSRWMFRVYESFADVIESVEWVEPAKGWSPSLTANDVVFLFTNMMSHSETDAIMNKLHQTGAFYWCTGASSFYGFIRHMASQSSPLPSV